MCLLNFNTCWSIWTTSAIVHWGWELCNAVNFSQDLKSPRHEWVKHSVAVLTLCIILQTRPLFEVFFLFWITSGFWVFFRASYKDVFFSFFFFFKILLIFRGEGIEKERERNINVWLPLVFTTTQACAPTGNWTWELNLQPFGPLVCWLVLSPLSYTSEGPPLEVLLLILTFLFYLPGLCFYPPSNLLCSFHLSSLPLDFSFPLLPAWMIFRGISWWDMHEESKPPNMD